MHVSDTKASSSENKRKVSYRLFSCEGEMLKRATGAVHVGALTRVL